MEKLGWQLTGGQPLEFRPIVNPEILNSTKLPKIDGKQIILRLADVSDVDEICRLEKLCYPGDGWDKSKYIPELEHRMSLSLALCWKSNPKNILGHVMARLKGNVASIDNLMVDPKYRGNHLGNILLDSMIKTFDDMKIGRIILIVRKSNSNAIKLYRKAVFNNTRMSYGYYHNPSEDGIYMHRNKS